MKNTLTLLIGLLLVSVGHLRGEDLATLDGRQFKNIKISAEKSDSIKLVHDDGISTILKKDLPPAFVALHQLSASQEATPSAENSAKKALLDQFIASTPVFTATDGREFKSSQIRDVEPSGLSIFADSGPVRVKFTDLPPAVRAAFQYDEARATAYEREREAKNKAAVGITQRRANAASLVDKRPSHARLALLQNVGTGWICHMQFLREVEKAVTTAHQGSPLSVTTTPGRAAAGRSGGKPTQTAPSIVYETSHVEETVVGSDEGEVIVFGLPDYNKMKSDLQDKWQWSGHVYWIGSFEKTPAVGVQGRVIIQAYVLDHDKAVRLVATNGPHREYGSDGEPKADVQAPEDPDEVAKRSERAKVRQMLDAGEYDQALELIATAQFQDRHDPAQLAEFQKNVVSRVQEKTTALSHLGENWEAATAYSAKFVEPRFTQAVGQQYDALMGINKAAQREGDKRLYDEILKTRSHEALDKYFLKAPVKSMLPEVAAYRRWLQNREAPRRPICRLVKIEWAEGLKKGIVGGTAIKLYVDGVGDQRNDQKEDNGRTGISVDPEGLRVAKLGNMPQTKVVNVNIQVFHVNPVTGWERLTTFSKDLSIEDIAKQAGVSDEKGNKYTFEVDAIVKEPFLPAIWRVAQ